MTSIRSNNSGSSIGKQDHNTFTAVDDSEAQFVEEGEIVRQEDQLNRSLSPRQVQMIAIAGIIGTGLFMGTAKSLATAGPASMLISYIIVGIVVYLIMQCLGEMSTYLPIAGSFCTFASRFVDESFGFALTWNYWFNDAVSTASDLTALQSVFEYWTDSFPTWVISLIFWLFLIALNAVHVKAYGEMEFWLSLLKVVTVVVFIILGIVVNCGANPQHEYLGFHYWHIGDAPFVDNFKGFASVFVTACFAFGGTESISITCGEMKNPSRTMPRVVKIVFWRIIIFYIISILIIGINVPYNYPNLDTGDITTSPFTLVFQFAGSQVAGSFMNAVIVTSVISAGNHALYAGTRILYSLAKQGYAPKFFGKLTKYQVPWVALLATSSISIVCFGSSFIGSGELWTWLQNLVGVSNQLAWLAIGITSIRFRKALKKQGKEHQLAYKNWTHPWGPWVVVIMVTFMILIQGWSAFDPWSVAHFFNLYVELFIMVAMIIAWKLIKRTKIVKLEEMDLETDRYVETEAEQELNEWEDSLTGWSRYKRKVYSYFV